MANETHKLIIIGGGPSAWAAATYAARADLKPVVLAGEKAGGQLMLTTVVENYPGFANGVDGPLLMVQMREQAEKFGTKVVEENVTILRRRDNATTRPLFEVNTTAANYTAEAVIVATGAETVWLGIPGEKELIGRGVSSCAVCDAAFFRDKKTVVVGGGDAAMEDVLALTKFAESVTVVHRRSLFRASKIMGDRVLQHPKVKVQWNTTVEKILGDKIVTGVVLKDTLTGQETELAADGVFVAVGHRPATEWLQGSGVETDAKGFVITRLGLEKKSVEMAMQALNEENKVAFPTMTSVEGIFGAGDVVDFRYKQAATAAAFGVMAALDAQWWLESKEA